MKKKVTANPYGSDDEFKEYIRQGYVKQVIIVVVLAAIIAATVLSSCATSKPGCPDPSRWERKTAFNK